jgi:hypothetical protein
MTTKTSLTVAPDNGGSVSVTITDVFDLIVKGPLVTQVFARAVANVITKLVAGVVEEIAITIDATNTNIELHKYENKVQLNVRKLEVATEKIAQAVNEAEKRSEYPAALRAELTNKLYQLFYDEMDRVIREAAK